MYLKHSHNTHTHTHIHTHTHTSTHTPGTRPHTHIGMPVHGSYYLPEYVHREGYTRLYMAVYMVNALIPFTKQSKPMFNSRQII